MRRRHDADVHLSFQLHALRHEIVRFVECSQPRGQRTRMHVDALRGVLRLRDPPQDLDELGLRGVDRTMPGQTVRLADRRQKLRRKLGDRRCVRHRAGGARRWIRAALKTVGPNGVQVVEHLFRRPVGKRPDFGVGIGSRRHIDGGARRGFRLDRRQTVHRRHGPTQIRCRQSPVASTRTTTTTTGRLLGSWLRDERVLDRLRRLPVHRRSVSALSARTIPHEHAESHVATPTRGQNSGHLPT